MIAENAKRAYPAARIVDQVDDYHGIKVADPYRWLEDADSAETKAWVEAENRITAGYLSGIESRGAIQKRLTALWNYERFGIPTKKGSRYFYTRNSGLQNQSLLYVADTLHATPRVLLDPNTLSKDGTVALAGTSVSEGGKYLAYGIATAGSDWVEYRVRDIGTGEDLPDLVKWVKFSGASWSKDGEGFFYSRYDAPKEGAALQEANYHQKVFYHRLGEDQAKDSLIYERPDHPDWSLRGGVSDDGRYLVISSNQGTERKNRVFYKDLTDPKSQVTELLGAGDASYGFVGNEGPIFYFLTSHQAPNSRVIAIDTRKPESVNWREVVKEAKEALDSATLFGDQLIAEYLRDAHSVVKVFRSSDGGLIREVSLPGLGSVGGFGGDQKDTETFYSFTSYAMPTTIYRYEIVSGKSEVFKKPQVAFDGDQYETRQVFYASKDGTRVPMFLTAKKGLKLDGSNPTLLYGYGGFNNSLTPGFSPTAAAWMEMGGVYAVANIRGGGEYGENWHEAGKKLKKQNVFDDFIAAAEYLIEEKITSSERLAINGGSNGGLLVGAVMEQRPDLFAAAIPEVGVMDMLRFSKFTIGWAWQSDYGSPEVAAEFKALYAYSPYHNLKPGTRYPATLVMTSDHDDRVVPAHSFKFAAALQAAQAPEGPPTLIRIEMKAGHGAGKPVSKWIEEYADKYAFLVKSLGITLPDGFGE
ncbi:MAG: S9 family peptidase [Cytophagales bacterium]|nr:S9 family peptidase [Armatimonadota bacterium]